MITLWKSQTTEEICNELKITDNQFSYIANRIRKVDKNILPKKHKHGTTDNLIREVIAEIK